MVPHTHNISDLINWTVDTALDTFNHLHFLGPRGPLIEPSMSPPPQIRYFPSSDLFFFLLFCFSSHPMAKYFPCQWDLTPVPSQFFFFSAEKNDSFYKFFLVLLPLPLSEIYNKISWDEYSIGHETIILGLYIFLDQWSSGSIDQKSVMTIPTPLTPLPLVSQSVSQSVCQSEIVRM